MSKDLEDFLRQAAEQRQRKLAERRALAEQEEQQTRPRTRPYSNARRERDVDATAYYDDIDEDVLDERDLEVIDTAYWNESGQDERNEPGASSESFSRTAMPDAKIVDPEHGGAQASKPKSADLLREMLRQPHGLRQAFLVREILSRPRY